MEIRTFVKRDGADSLFFEVTWEGLFVELAEGPIGTDGKVLTREFRTTEEVVDFIRAQIEEHLAEGFEEHVGDDPPSLNARDVTNPEMEAAIDANPDAVAPYLVYADWLEGQGDPRGELIALQHRIITGDDHPELLRQEEHLLHVHREYLVGDLGLFPDSIDLNWYLGFISQALINLSSSRRDEGLRSAPFVEDLLKRQSARFLQELRVGYAAPDPDTRTASFDPVIEIMARYGPLPHLHTLVLGNAVEDTRYERYSVSKLDALWGSAPALKRLELQFEDVRLDSDSTFASVEHLMLGFESTSTAAFDILSANPHPDLQSLHLGARTLPEDALNALTPDRFPALRELTLFGAHRPGPFVEVLAKGDLLPQLRVLALPHAFIPLELVETHGTALAHLDRFVVDTGLQHKGLEGAVPGLTQRPRVTLPDDEYDYDYDDAGGDDYYDDLGE